jgi:integrase
MSDRAREAFLSQMKGSGDSEYLFPSPFEGGKKPHITTVRKLWDRTLKRAGLPHFSLYGLRHTFATRLSAGGVADRFVAQMLRQGESGVSSVIARRSLAWCGKLSKYSTVKRMNSAGLA